MSLSMHMQVHPSVFAVSVMVTKIALAEQGPLDSGKLSSHSPICNQYSSASALLSGGDASPPPFGGNVAREVGGEGGEGESIGK